MQMINAPPSTVPRTTHTHFTRRTMHPQPALGALTSRRHQRSPIRGRVNLGKTMRPTHLHNGHGRSQHATRKRHYKNNKGTHAWWTVEAHAAAEQVHVRATVQSLEEKKAPPMTPSHVTCAKTDTHSTPNTASTKGTFAPTPLLGWCVRVAAAACDPPPLVAA